jgi:chemotaxis protein methyltransferase CheR
VSHELLVGGLPQLNAKDFERFRKLIHERTGIFIRDGRQLMLSSRLARRLRHHGMTSFSEYLALVESSREGEINELINVVTTNKTSFFREVHHFDFLKKTLVPERQNAAQRGEPKKLRFWSAASSTGQEAYSILISLLEANAGAVSGWDIHVTASDIDTEVLKTAASGIYSAASIEEIEPSLRSKYFLRGKGDMEGRIKAKPILSSRVDFKRINLQDESWPIEGLFDGIFFRNALIYFDLDTQAAFLRKMLRYLRPKGYLFLGHSEHVPWLYDMVDPLSQTIYQLKDRAGGLAARPACKMESRALHSSR